MDQRKKFDLGQVVATPGALAAIGYFPNDLLTRHESGDWGEVSIEDQIENNKAIANGLRILSVYTVAGTKIWVITEADRSSTTVLLPEEY